MASKKSKWAVLLLLVICLTAFLCSVAQAYEFQQTFTQSVRIATTASRRVATAQSGYVDPQYSFTATDYVLQKCSNLPTIDMVGDPLASTQVRAYDSSVRLYFTYLSGYGAVGDYDYIVYNPDDFINFTTYTIHGTWMP